VQRGVGRFGPFIKWNGTFINVSKKYNFDNLSQADLVELIESKMQKDIDKVVHNWEEEGIKVEKARWGRSVLTKGKIKIELSKDFDAAGLTLEKAKAMIAEKTPVKKAAAKKAPAKKPAASTAKKTVAKKK
jgi:DNA topoisomerase-1